MSILDEGFCLLNTSLLNTAAAFNRMQILS